MASLLDIKEHLKAIANIQKVTRAMQLVAAAKFKRSESRARTVRPYGEEFDRVLAGLIDDAGGAGPESTIEIDIRAGKMIILVDDEDRENEGDLCMAAEKATPVAINFMARRPRPYLSFPEPEHGRQAPVAHDGLR